jgi:hypothetical protein
MQGSRLILIAAVSSLAFASRPAFAMSRDVRSVIVAGEYGMLGGTLLGIASLPLARSGRSVFIGTSVGLYLGIVAGIYYIHHRDDPGNPLRRAARERQLEPRDPTRDDPAEGGGLLSRAASPLFQAQVQILRF